MPAKAANAFTHLPETVWEFREKLALHEPGRLIARPLTAPLPAKRRGEGAPKVAPSPGADEAAAVARSRGLPSPSPRLATLENLILNKAPHYYASFTARSGS